MNTSFISPEIDESRSAKALPALPQGDALDIYVVNEQFQEIQHVAVMETFLLQAARRLHVLNASFVAATEADCELPMIQQKAWEVLRDQFDNPAADLRMFFSETDDYHDQSPEERKRLNAVADLLVNSAKDASKIEQAERLGATAEVGMADESNDLSDKQRAAVVAFRDANGRDWKKKLGALWMNGNYSRSGIDMDQAALLQQVRNQFGPEWLENVAAADLNSPQRLERDDSSLCM